MESVWRYLCATLTICLILSYIRYIESLFYVIFYYSRYLHNQSCTVTHRERVLSACLRCEYMKAWLIVLLSLRPSMVMVLELLDFWPTSHCIYTLYAPFSFKKYYHWSYLNLMSCCTGVCNEFIRKTTPYCSQDLILKKVKWCCSLGRQKGYVW